MEAAIQARRVAQPATLDDDPPVTLWEVLPLLFRYGYMEPGPLGIRAGGDGALHIVVTATRDADWLRDIAPRFDAEWHAAGCPRLLLLTRDETQDAVAAIDRGDLVCREGKPSWIWWASEGAAKTVPYVFLAQIESTAKVLRDQGEPVNSLADLRALLTEALNQPD